MTTHSVTYHCGQRVRHAFLGTGTVIDVLSRAAGLIYVLWDRTPPVDYNTGVNPSVVLAEALKEGSPHDTEGETDAP